MSDSSKRETIGDHVTLDRRGRVVKVTYDRRDGLNALSAQGMTELKAAALSLAGDTTSSVIVLTGTNVFSAGADLKDLALRQRDEMSLLEQRMALRLGPDLCQAWADLEQITIAAIEGFCVGGGLALAAACDHRVAARSAHFRLPEVPLGMNMSWRTLPRLVALIGPSRTKQLVILGRKVEAETAEAWGLVDQLSAHGGALEAAAELADAYAALPPLALRMTKQAINVSAEPLGHATSFMDRDQFLLARQSGDQAEAIAAFLGKRPPTFTGD